MIFLFDFFYYSFNLFYYYNFSHYKRNHKIKHYFYNILNIFFLTTINYKLPVIRTGYKLTKYLYLKTYKNYLSKKIFKYF